MPTIMAGITETNNKEQQVNYIFTVATPLRLLEMDGQIITGTFKHYTQTNILSKEKYVKMIDRLICQTLLRAPERKLFQTRLYFIPRT